MTWAMMSAAPQAVWYGGRVKVSSGFMIANLGRMHSAPASLLYQPSSLVMTEPLLDSLPAAGMVSTTPTGSISFTLGLPGVEIPHVAGVRHADGDGLGRVDDAAAADREDAGQLVLPEEPDALLHEGEPGVGHHAAQLLEGDARLLQARAHPVEQARRLDALPAVVQQDALRHGGGLPADRLLGAPAEDDPGRVLEDEVLHGYLPRNQSRSNGRGSSVQNPSAYATPTAAP